MKAFIKEIKATVTVFVAMILVPSIFFVALLLDFAMSSAVNNREMSVLTANSVMTEYNGLLKQVYGLFLIDDVQTKNEKIDEDVLKLTYSDGLSDADNSYYSLKRRIMEVSFSKKQKGDNATLSNIASNPMIILNQISQHMKYRAPALWFGSVINMEQLTENMEGVSKDSKVIDSSNQLSKEIFKLQDDMINFVEAVDRHDAFHFNGMITQQLEDANDIVKQLESNAEEIESLEDELDNASQGAESDSVYAFYLSALRSSISSLKSSNASLLEELRSSPEEKWMVKRLYDEVYKKSAKIESQKLQVRIAYEKFSIDYQNSSEEMKSGMKELYDSCKGIFEHDFSKVPPIIENNPSDYKKWVLDTNAWINASYTFSGDSVPTTLPAIKEFSISFKKVTEDPVGRTLLSEARKWHSTDKDEKKAARKLKELGKKMKSDTENQEKDNFNLIRGAKSVSPEVSKQLYLNSFSTQPSGASGEDYYTEKIKEIADSSINSNIKQEGLKFLNKLYLIEYDMGMFSGLSSGKKEGKAVDIETISGIPISTKMNYFFGNEYEYLFGGHNTAVANIAQTIGTISGFVVTRNFIITYKDSTVNSTIKSIAQGVAAVGTPALGAATDIALRLGVAGIETGLEVNDLINGETIDLAKKKIRFNLDDETFQEKDNDQDLSVGYDHIIRILLLGFVDDQTLLQRTMNLIELNTSNYYLSANADADKLTSLPFRFVEKDAQFVGTTSFKAKPLLGLGGAFNISDEEQVKHGWRFYNFQLYDIAFGY